MATPQAFDTDHAQAVGVGLIVALLVIGLVASIVVRAVLAKVITVVVVVVLVAVVWTQRAAIKDAAKRCDATFFGVHLTPSNQQVRERCEQLSR